MERAFRLAGLLRLRTLQEDQAAARLAASNAALRAAEQHRSATLTELVGHALPAHADTRAWQQSVTGRSTLARLLADAAVQVTDAGGRVAEDTAGWAAARSRSVGLEKLHDKHRAAVALEDGRAEQLALDEVASRRSPSVAAMPARMPARPSASPRTAS